MDNTHLRWSPDWETPINKAMNEGYHVLAMTPPLNEYMFCTNRSGHGVDEKLFFSMAAMWGGHKFSPFLYKLVAPQALKGMTPLKRDNFIKMKLVKWGRGWLYVQDQYLGYVDKEMVYATLQAGFELNKAGLDEYFMKKDGNIHITLIEPGRYPQDQLMKVAEALKSLFPEAPKTTYTGVGTLEIVEQGKQTWFLTADATSQNEWNKAIEAATQKAVGKAGPLQPDGVHVTIGFTESDIWRKNKLVDPILPFPNNAATTEPTVFLPPFRGEITVSPTIPADGAREGTQAPWLPVRRPDDRLRDDAGLRPGQRPPDGLLRPMTVANGP